MDFDLAIVKLLFQFTFIFNSKDFSWNIYEEFR